MGVRSFSQDRGGLDDAAGDEVGDDAPDGRVADRKASDAGGRRAAAVYSLIATCKLNDVDPRAWLADVLARLPDHPPIASANSCHGHGRLGGKPRQAPPPPSPRSPRPRPPTKSGGRATRVPLKAYVAIAFGEQIRMQSKVRRRGSERRGDRRIRLSKLCAHAIAELAVDIRGPNMHQHVRASERPAHLLALGHALRKRPSRGYMESDKWGWGEHHAIVV